MSDRYRVVPTVTFRDDIERLEERIVERGLARDTPHEICIVRFSEAIQRAMGILAFAPHTCRRCEQHREFRELIVPIGQGGFIALFVIRELDVLLVAARAQHEHDYR